MSETVTLVSPRTFTLRAGTEEIQIVQGTNLDFPKALSDHWYVKANGCTVVGTTAATEPAAPAAEPAPAPATQAAEAPKPAKGGKGAKATETVAEAGAGAANVQAALNAEAKGTEPAAPWAKKE